MTYVCPVCDRVYISPAPLSEHPVPGERVPGPTCSGSRSGGKHTTRVMVLKEASNA